MERSIADRLKEFKTASSARGESKAFSNSEHYNNQSNVSPHGTYRPDSRRGYSQGVGSSQTSAPSPFHAQHPPARPQNSSAPFPVPPTAPIFDPSAPPPGLPPFSRPPPSALGQRASGPVVRQPPPPFPPQNSAASIHPQNSFGAIPPQSCFGTASWQNTSGAFPPQNSAGSVPRQSNFGNVPPQNNFGNVPPQNNFGNVPPQNFGNVPQQGNFGNVPPQNNFGNVPPPNNFGNVPPQNNFGNVPPPNNFGNVPPQSNYGNFQPQSNSGNVVPQATTGPSSSMQHPRFPPYTLPEGQANFSTPPPFSRPLQEPTPGESGRVSADQCDVGAQQEVNIWLKKMGKLKETDPVAGSTGKADSTAAAAAGSDPDQRKQDSLSIGQAHKKLRNLLHALAAVQGELQQLKEDQATVDTETWKASVVKIRELKEAYIEAKREVDANHLKDLKRKLDKCKKKRDRQRRRKQEEKELEQQTLFERAQKHAAIDQWRNQIQQEHLNQQQVKRMKETADKTLSKVRREIRESRKMLDTVNRLQKLRAVRNDTAEKRGQTFPASVAEHFTEKTNDLAQLLAQQIEAFEKEEAALKLLLETEKQEAKEKEKEEKRQKEEELRRSEKEEEKLCLFGPLAQPHHGDPMLPFVNFYYQAQYNFHSLLNIRKEWDTFLVLEKTPMASRIPDGWVIPEPPSSAVWASTVQPQSPCTMETI